MDKVSIICLHRKSKMHSCLISLDCSIYKFCLVKTLLGSLSV